MPYSDNMYSGGNGSESDGGNHVDQLSPLDGYFASSSSSSHGVPNVPNIIIPDPTLQQRIESDAESKGRPKKTKEERFRPNTHRSRAYYFHPPTELGNNEEIGLSEQRAGTPTESRQPQYQPTVAHTYSPLSAFHAHIRSYTARSRTPSIYSDAPPAYSPEPSPVTPPNQQTPSRNYNTFISTMGVSDVVENERLLGRGPESMGQPQDIESGNLPSHWMKRARRRLPTWLNCRVLTFGLIVLVVSVGFLAGSLRIFKVEDDHRKTIGAQPVKQIPPDSEKEPVTEPGTDMPVVAAPFMPTYCENAQYRFDDQVLALNFDQNRNVTFIEDQHAHAGTSQVRVAGQVNVRRLDSGGSPRLVLEIATNDKDILLDVYADEEAQALKVSVPKKSDVFDPDNWPCVEIRTTIWVPQDAELGMLTLSVVHLDILLLDDLALHVLDYSRLSSVIGNINSGADRPITYNASRLTSSLPDFTFVPARDSYIFDARVIEATSTSGNINGNWPLYDMLGLHSTSGNIGVSITPQAELPSDPKPAVLSLSSVSGTIQATEPVHVPAQIPLRDYLVDVKSTSGGIRGALAFGAGVELKSTASDLALDLLPVMHEGRVTPALPAQLETATTSGTTAVRVLEPVWFGDNGTAVASKPLDCLQALHKSTSGDIGLRYPQAWEGSLYAETTAGRLKVRGKDVKVVRSVGGWPGSKMEARKGAGASASTIQVHALMGNMDAVIGNV